ncbi:MAG: cupin domain-containing protein [Candidatus Brocadiae bacterium]|nr:cupin domain-containing protein [Candidatus Brocadiia bacterium]
MSDVIIEKNPSQDKIQKMGIKKWSIWTKEASEFPWFYDEEEHCYFLEGEVEVLNEAGKSFYIQKGDLVTFPQGMSCIWKIKKAVKKHYYFGKL